MSEFLGTLEELQIPANRVTFQLCVALFCEQGDISGATAILQHMKANNLAINEAVFHSLLAAHAANSDPDSVASTIEVMSNSGLPIGAEGKFQVFLSERESYNALFQLSRSLLTVTGGQASGTW